MLTLSFDCLPTVFTMMRSMSSGAIQTSTYNGEISENTALECALALSMSDGRVACDVKYGLEMNTARIQRFEQASGSSKTRASSQSGRVAVAAQKAAQRRMSNATLPSWDNVSMTNSCLFTAVGAVMGLDPRTLKYVTMQHLKKKR